MSLSSKEKKTSTELYMQCLCHDVNMVVPVIQPFLGRLMQIYEEGTTSKPRPFQSRSGREQFCLKRVAKCSTVVEQSTAKPKIKGLDPATARHRERISEPN
jgi:hypothetical protein